MSNYEFWDELGKIFEAVVAYQEKSVEFNKRFIHPWIRLGNVFDKQDRNAEAVRVYEQAIELDPANAQNWYELGNIHFQMQSYEAAAQAYDKAIQLTPESGWPYSNLALTLATQGKFVEAVPLYQKGIELLADGKDKAVAWNRLGNAYRKLDQYELALQAFQMADELDEDNAGFRDQLDEIPDGPSLVEGVASDSAGSETEMIVEPVLLSLAESAVEDPAAVAEAAAEAEAPVTEVQVEMAEAVGDVLETVAETEPAVAEAASDSAVAEVMEAPIAAAIDADVPTEALGEADAEPGPQVTESVPAWVAENPPIEIADLDLEVESAGAEAEPVMEVVPVAAVLADDDTRPIAVARMGEPAAEPVAAAEAAPESAAEISEPEAMAEEVAIVDPAQSYDEIVVTDDAAPSAEVETAALENVDAVEPEAAAAEAEIDAAPEPVVEPVAEAIAEPAAKTIEETEPVASSAETAHAAYDVYLKDNEELTALSTASDEDAAHEEAAPASEEPVAQIGPSGDVRIEMDAKNAHVWNELGNVYFSTGAYDDAVVAYTKAIELDRWFAWPYSNLALAYMQKGRFAEATLLYQRSIELFSSEKDKAISWNRLGNVYRRLNDYDNAIAAYQRADELDPDNSTLSLQSRFSLLGSFSLEQKQKPSYAL